MTDNYRGHARFLAKVDRSDGLGFTGIGCGSSGGKKSTTLDTPSGSPEVVIQSADIKPILDAARAFFTGRGYFEIPSRHAHEVVFDRRLEDSRKSQALRVRLRGVQRLIRRRGNCWAGHSKSTAGRATSRMKPWCPYGFPQVQEFLEAIKLQVELSLGSDLNI
jgi:hypothetical protein